jgi:hypothetical protein
VGKNLPQGYHLKLARKVRTQRVDAVKPDLTEQKRLVEEALAKGMVEVKKAPPSKKKPNMHRRQKYI